MNKKISFLLSLMISCNFSVAYGAVGNQYVTAASKSSVKSKNQNKIKKYDCDTVVENMESEKCPSYEGDSNDISVRTIGSNKNINVRRKNNSIFEDDVQFFKTLTNHMENFKSSFEMDGKLRAFDFAKQGYGDYFGINRTADDEPVVEAWKWDKGHRIYDSKNDNIDIFNTNLTMEALKYYAQSKENGIEIWLKLDEYFNDIQNSNIFDGRIHKFGKTKVMFEDAGDSKVNVIFIDEDISYEKNEVIFYDRAFKESIKKALNTENEKIYKNDLSDIKELDLSMRKIGILSRGMGITSLEGIQYCTNLESLNLIGSRYLEDISYLKDLIKLRNLNLKYSGVKDISALKRLKNLESLNIEETGVKDISSLDFLIKLKELKISGEIKEDDAGEKRIEEKEKKLMYINKDFLRFDENGVSMFSILSEDDEKYYGAVNKDYEVISEPIFDSSYGGFNEGKAYVRIKRQRGTIDFKGNIDIPYEFDDISHSFSEGYACSNVGSSGFIVDTKGKINYTYSNEVKEFIPFENGYMVVKNKEDSSEMKEQTLILDKNLDVVLKFNSPQDIEFDFYGGYVKAVEYVNGVEKHVVKRISDGKNMYEFKDIDIDKSQRYDDYNYSDWIENINMYNGKMSLYDFDNGIKYKERYYDGDKYIYRDEYDYLKGLYDIEKKEFVSDLRYSRAEEFRDGLAKFYDGTYVSKIKKASKPKYFYGFMDRNGKVIIDGKSICRKINREQVVFTEFNNGYCVILCINPEKKTEWIYGLMDTKGNIVIKPKYKFLGNYNDGVFLAVEDIKGKEVIKYIDVKGKTIFELLDDMYPVYYSIHYGPIEYEKLRFTENKEAASDFYEGKAVMTRVKVVDGEEQFEYGYIDKKGKWFLEPKYKETRNYSNGYGLVVENEDCAYYLDKDLNRMGYYSEEIKEKRKLIPVSKYEWQDLDNNNKLYE